MLNSKEIAETILAQLGGNKFVAMTGAHNFVNTGAGLLMKLRKNKSGATHLNIVYNSSDLYDMKFMKVKVSGFSIVENRYDIYNDMLQEVFTNVTGMYTSL